MKKRDATVFKAGSIVLEILWKEKATQGSLDQTQSSMLEEMHKVKF